MGYLTYFNYRLMKSPHPTPLYFIDKIFFFMFLSFHGGGGGSNNAWLGQGCSNLYPTLT